MRIYTNNHPRELLAWHELPAEAKAEFDYYDDPENETGLQFFRYRGGWYDLSEFLLPPNTVRAAGWDGYVATSVWDGVLVRRCEDGDHVVVGSYTVSDEAGYSVVATPRQLAVLQSVTGVSFPCHLGYAAAQDMIVAYCIAKREPRLRPAWIRFVRRYGGPDLKHASVRWNLRVQAGFGETDRLRGLLEEILREDVEAPVSTNPEQECTFP